MLNKYARAKMGMYLYILTYAIFIALIIFLVINKKDFTKLFKETTTLEYSFKNLFNFKGMKFNKEMSLGDFSHKFIYPTMGLVGALLIFELLLLVVAVFSILTSLKLGLLPSLLILIGVVVPIVMFLGFLMMAQRAQREALGQSYKKSRRQDSEEY